MNKFRRASNDLSDLLELVIKGMFAITIVYLVAKTLIEIIVGPFAAKIISLILGINLLFGIVVSKRISKEILSFGKKN